DGPDVPEGIDKGAAAVTVKLVLHGPHDLGAGSRGLGGERIHVLNVQHEADGSAAERFGAAVAHLRELVGEHEWRVADFHFGVHDLAAGTAHAEQLGSPERLLVELNRVGCSVDDQIRGDCVIALGYRPGWAGHGSSSKTGVFMGVYSSRQVSVCRPSLLFRSRSLDASFVALRPQHPEVVHQLPALEFGKRTERRHTAPGISLRDLPEERAVALLLDDRQLEVGGLLHTAAVFAVALGAIAQEQLATATHDVVGCRKGVRTRDSFRGRFPVGIRLVTEVLSRDHQRGGEHGKCQAATHYSLPNNAATLRLKPWIS